ncbi:MAG: 30S ribosomal protein S6e [Candidatus Marsarchaeota archaeon]|nr:30S ribosomal protein S6e [Candidatus Marsarchaeota archaeon]
MKIVYSDRKTGRSAQVEVGVDAATAIIGRRIGEAIDGAALGLPGYKLKITGGSDSSGFPLERGIGGSVKTAMLAHRSAAGRVLKSPRRRTVRGGLVAADTAQVNAVITDYGAKPLDEVLPPKAAAAKEAGKEDAASEERKPKA